jgi:hypothetical protein
MMHKHNNKQNDINTSLLLSGPESLTAYCRSLLTAGRFEFFCPYIFPENNTICNKLWDFYIVRQFAVLTPEEIKEFEIMITNNYIRKAMGLQVGLIVVGKVGCTSQKLSYSVDFSVKIITGVPKYRYKKRYEI